MSDHRTSTSAPAVSTAKPTDERVADAMRDLDADVRALMMMADIASNAWDDLGPPVSTEGEKVTYRMSRHERDKFDFLLNNVAERAALLLVRFDAAWTGEKK